MTWCSPIRQQGKASNRGGIYKSSRDIEKRRKKLCNERCFGALCTGCSGRPGVTRKRTNNPKKLVENKKDTLLYSKVLISKKDENVPQIDAEQLEAFPNVEKLLYM